MVSRSNQGINPTGQLKKKILISSEENLPSVVQNDIKDLFTFYDKDNLGLINFSQLKAILHYISGGVMTRISLEGYMTENSPKMNNFELSDVEKLATKLWKKTGKEHYQKDVNRLLSGLKPYSNNDELEAALKDRLSNIK